MNSSVIKKLVERYTKHTNPDVSTTVEQGLIQLSSGIYTEEERFVFELLQNAVDAFESSMDTLKVKMLIKDNYLVFMHNGKAFSSRDIEGVCDIGHGNKIKDTKKIGYKGIGFKSVFMCSTCVTVKSGEYSFKFDKLHWENYWDKNWDRSFGLRNEDKQYLMPWRILPIESEPPINVDSKEYNVVTYIKTSNTTSLENKILKLLESSQLLLFLKCKSISVKFLTRNNREFSITKSTKDDQVALSTSGTEDTRWLIYINEAVSVPETLRLAIRADINTPQKLKDANSFDLSFAIPLDKNGKLKRLEKEESIVYTYLPTSFKFGSVGFPFLVNANFITDAGRQQLHKDSEWNKLIFSKIPSEYLTWMTKISSLYTNYYDVLPERSYGHANSLELIYEEEMRKAIDTIAFIPRLNNPKSKVLARSAVLDRVGIMEAISGEALITHINREYKYRFTKNDFIAPIWKGSKVLLDYGVFAFDKQKIKNLFSDTKAFANINPDLNIKLIDFLFQYYLNNKTEQNELLSVLHSTKFLIDQQGILCLPSDLFFPSEYKSRNDLAENAKFLHSDVYKALSENYDKLEWVTKLGVEKLSDTTFIKNVICKDDYITKENAIEVGRYVFNASKKEDIFESIGNVFLSNMKFLTKGGDLKKIEELYLGSAYHPELDIEKLYGEDIYISDDYIMSNADEWKIYLKKLGAVSSFDITLIKKEYSDFKQDIYDGIVVDAWKESSKLLNFGWPYHPQFLHIEYYPLINIQGSNREFSKYFWSSVFCSEYKKDDNSCIVGYFGLYWSYRKSPKICDLVKRKLREYILGTVQTYPSSDLRMLTAKELYLNTSMNVEIAGSYLPVINVECEISKEWQDVLQLKKDIDVESLLYILREISNDIDHIEENKNRIMKIYQRLIDLDCLKSDAKKNQIKKWSSTNKILSKDNKFVNPSELSHITLDGFTSKNRVFIDKVSDRAKLIELFSLMGVRIITENSIKTDFEEKREANELRRILMQNISPIVVLALAESTDQLSYDEKKSSLLNLLQQTHFYHCNKIKLTYGNAEDVIEKYTFGNKNEFYYIGDIRPASVEPLLTPLCRYLGIMNKERELFIILIDNIDGIRQNLADKGYDVSLIESEPETLVESGTIQTTLNYKPDADMQYRNLITGFKGEIIVYEKLIQQGYKPKCLSISTKNDYEHKIEMNGKVYYCKRNFENFDISFTTESGIEMFLEVKATTCSKRSQENMPISYNELSMLERCNSEDDKCYVIARVFGIGHETQDIYLFKGHLLEN